MIREGVASYLPDIDPEETSEWLESFDAMLARSGPSRARYLILRLLERAGEQRVAIPALTSTDYVNTIPTELEPWFPGDEEVERRYRRWIRWNAAVMVHRAQRPGSRWAATSRPTRPRRRSTRSVSTTSSAVSRIRAAATRCSSRVTLPRRLCARLLGGTADRRAARRVPPGTQPPRRWAAVVPAPAADARLLGVPHRIDGPGPMNAIYQARFNHYLHDRGIKDTSDQHVWCFLGDGEMDEPESRDSPMLRRWRDWTT
ncbi:pyruvate dehydrogenase E1 component domain protein [Mycobacterium xenopi 3993]|nr:pyruvate dehydrogenase E1 component domain protein [Mycobacterium xenopi 3993]